MVMRSRAIDGRSASRCQRKWPDQPLDRRSGCQATAVVRAARRSCQNAAKAQKFSRIGIHLGNPGLTLPRFGGANRRASREMARTLGRSVLEINDARRQQGDETWQLRRHQTNH